MITSLFALSNDARLLANQINATAEGLLSDDPAEVGSAIEALEGLITAEADNRQALLSKADAWCWVIETLRAQADARKQHAKRLALLADADERHASDLQERLVKALLSVDSEATSWEFPEHKLKSRATEAVLIDEGAELSIEFTRRKVELSPDKEAIKKAIKAGRRVSGAQLIQRRSWSIR